MATKAPDWTKDDVAAVSAMVKEILADEPSLKRARAHVLAARSHFSRTGRVSSHSNMGYAAGCRCRACQVAHRRKP